MPIDPVTVLVTDADLVPITNPVTTYTSVSLELRFNEVGSGELIAPADSELVAAVTTPGANIVVLRGTTIWGGGKAEKPGGIKWGPEGGVGSVRVNFATPELWLAQRLAYPDPSLASTSGSQPDAYTITATNAEVAMRALVNTGAGVGALAARQVPHLDLGALASVGTNVTVTTDFDQVLTETLRTIAKAGGGLGFRVRLTGLGTTAELLFEVWEPEDKSAAVRFSRSVGNLRSLETDPEAPTCTVAIVSDGAGTVVEREDAAAVALWGRIEKYVLASGVETAGTTELEQAGDLALLDGAEQVGVSAEGVDTQWLRYGDDYQLGDYVGVEIRPGYGVSALVTAAKLTATPETGAVITTALGQPERVSKRTVWAIRELTRRVSRLERS